jgi:hypothetical protein
MKTTKSKLTPVQRRLQSYVSSPLEWECPEVFQDSEGYLRKDTFIWLNSFLKITEDSKKLERNLRAKIKKDNKYNQTLGFSNREIIKEYLSEKGDYAINDDYLILDGFKMDYTYNYDNFLTDDIQFGLISNENLKKYFILIQIHTYGDARNIGDGSIFEVAPYSEAEILNYDDIYAGSFDESIDSNIAYAAMEKGEENPLFDRETKQWKNVPVRDQGSHKITPYYQ